MKGKIKRHRRRARRKEALYNIAVDAWNIFLRLIPVWGPNALAIFSGGLIWLLGW